MNKDQIRKWVEDNPDLVRMRRSKRYPHLFVLKYHNRVFYDNLWHKSPLLLDMRGTVVDEDFNPIVMPFRKVFNQYENNTNIDRDEQVVAVKKINGFMAAVTVVPDTGEVLVSTTGSLDSPFADMAREILPMEKSFIHIKGFRVQPTTWLFEIVHPNDPHVVPEKVGAYLLGARYPHWGEEVRGVQCQHYLDDYAKDFEVMRPSWKLIRFSDLCKEVKECKHEGYVAYGSQTTLKLKSPYYKITKLFGRGNIEKLLKLDKTQIDEEYYPLIDYIKSKKIIFDMLSEQGKFEFIRNFLNEN